MSSCSTFFTQDVATCVTITTTQMSFVYESVRDDCRILHVGTEICNFQKSQLYKSIEDCRHECVETIAIADEKLTCKDSPCKPHQKCIESQIMTACFKPPCPQYSCLNTDDFLLMQ